MTIFRSALPRFALPAALAVAGALLCWVLIPLEVRAVDQQLSGFPDSDEEAHLLRPLILGALCFFPALVTLAYAFGGALDRYLARQFGGIFLVCLAALIVIWLLIDLNDNLSDFRDSDNVLGTVLTFYGMRSPAVLLLLLPYTLLLALIYALGKLSTNLEIIAMIQAGRGVVRVTLPLIVAGALTTLFCLALNYHWAPVAEGNKDEILDAARGVPITEAKNVLFRNAEERRLWKIGAFPKDYEKGEPLLGIEVTTTLEDHALESRLTAASATWDRGSRAWIFHGAVIGEFTPGMPPQFEIAEGPVERAGWSETPWQLIKPGLAAAYLGIPDLNGWLQANETNRLTADPSPYLTQWHYRFALPVTCLVTVLLAAPLSIHFSRRGPGGGVFLAVVLSALMMLVTSIALALGESALLPPALAAWLPNAAFALLGLYLFQRRISGRPIYQSLRRFFPGAP
jgi:lipopolysaccharide export system permease protein